MNGKNTIGGRVLIVESNAAQGDLYADLVATHCPSTRIDVCRTRPLPHRSPGFQPSKIPPLRLVRYLHSLLYATHHRHRRANPDPHPFPQILSRLAVASSNAVFVGDDERCDIGGARRAGLMTVRCRVWRAGGIATAAHAVVTRLSLLTELAQRLLEETSDRHAA